MTFGFSTNTCARNTALIALATLIASTGHAQESTNKTVLITLSQQRTVRNKLYKDQAERAANSLGLPLKMYTPEGDILVLLCWRFGRPNYISTTGTADAKTVGTSELWPSGSLGLAMTGRTTKMGIWEAGGIPRLTHQELRSRIKVYDGETSISSHATHVAGIMIGAGLNAAAKGMSYESRLLAYEASNDDAEAALEASRGLNVSNHSYAYIGGWRYGYGGQNAYYWLGDTTVSEVEDWTMGYYDDISRAWDQVLYNAPFYLPCFGAGNWRTPNFPTGPISHYVWDFATNDWKLVTAARYGQQDYDTITFGPQISKNSLTVGAVSNVNGTYTSPADVSIAGFSSTGPADDGRIKPDICGVGVNVLSAVSSSDSSYGNNSGTSMASPNVAGSINLLQELFGQLHGGAKMRAASLKGLIIHTANEAGPNNGPDYIYGWGLLNEVDAANTVIRSAFDPAAIQEYTLRQNQPIQIPFYVGAVGIVKATICWTDPAGTPGPAALDRRVPMLVNDLDVRVIRRSDGRTYMPWVLNADSPSQAARPGDNSVDNVEQVVVYNADPGEYIAEISHKGTLMPANSQAVSAVITAPGNTAGKFQSLTIDPAQVVGGIESSTATLRLSGPAVADTTVNILSTRPDIAIVPAALPIGVGQSELKIPIITRSAKPAENESGVRVTIIAASNSGSLSAGVTILPVGVSSFVFNPAATSGGNTVEATLSLNGPAPKGGATVLISSDRPSVAKPTRNYVYFPEGTELIKTKIRTSTVKETTNVTFIADRLGNKFPAVLTVRPARLDAVAAAPSILHGGQATKFTISLDGLAPSAGSIIQLSSSNPLLVPVPASVTIGSGKRTATFVTTTSATGVAATVTITASRLNISRTTDIRVLP